jgi:CRISPR-associated protein Cas5a/b/c
MIGYIVDVEFVWGFQARIAGLSKTSPSFYYPPPTTFLGAMAEVIAKEHEIGEKRGKEIVPALSEKLLAIGWRALNCIPVKYSDINRILAVKITSGILYPNPKDLGKSFDSPARGKTVLSTLDSDAPKIRWFLVFRDDRFEFDDNETRLDERLFWKMHRLGSKESRVSVVDVARVKPETLQGKVITSYSFPVEDGVNPAMVKEGRWEFEVYINPFEVGRYDEKENPVINYISGKRAFLFRIPVLKDVLATPEYIVEVGGNFAAYKADNEVVIGRWSE